MGFSNHIIGFAAVLGAAAIVAGTFGFREIPGQQFGSAFFPRITAGALALTGLALIVTSPGGPHVSLPTWVRTVERLRAAAIPIAGLLWVLAAPMFGFLLTTFVMIFALSMIAGGRLLTSLGVAAGVSAVLHVIFSSVLRIPLPFGVIERWVL
ncbi:MAG: tripartite tricarboxylate transporter TctB family protein [Pseudomonadota bacterium]